MKKLFMTALTGLALLSGMEVLAQGYPPPDRDPYKGTAGGVRLASDIVDLVASLFGQRTIVVAAPQPTVLIQPQPVIVQQPVTTTTTIIQQPFTTTTTTVIQQPATTIVIQQPAGVVQKIPTYTYIYYNNSYVPYYAGWYFYRGRWCWGRPGPAPRPPQWRPNPTPPRGGSNRGHHGR